MSVGVDFDFARWIAKRRGAVEQQAREGIAYAFSGERRFRRTLVATRPVAIALEATTRTWREKAHELLLPTQKVSETQNPQIFAAAKRAGATLRVRVPTIFASTAEGISINALGMDDAPYLLINPSIAAALLKVGGEDALVAAIGHELGHVQNGHVLYCTALHYLRHSAAFFVRWAVQPAIVTLQAWARRADFTCDRAALLSVSNLDATLTSMAILHVGVDKLDSVDIPAFLRDLPDPSQASRFSKATAAFRSNPFFTKRVHALRWFSDCAYYAIAHGKDASGKPSMIDVDAKVADLTKLF